MWTCKIIIGFLFSRYSWEYIISLSQRVLKHTYLKQDLTQCMVLDHSNVHSYEVVEDRLAELILEDKVVEGSSVSFDVQDGEIEVTIS